jgi:hypothetical protein
MSVKYFELVAMINSLLITLEPRLGIGVMGWRPSPGLNLQKEGM